MRRGEGRSCPILTGRAFHGAGLVLVSVCAGLAGGVPGTVEAREYWPMACQGPMAAVRYEAGSIRFEARAGMRPASPARGECVWMDRAVDRPGESRGGTLSVEVPLGRNVVPTFEARGGRTSVRFGHALADSIWTAATRGGRFTVRVQRRGTARYVATTAPAATAAPSRASDGTSSVRAAPAGAPPASRPTARAAPSRGTRSGVRVRATPVETPGTQATPGRSSLGRGPSVVRVRIDRIKVHSDGDSASAGDWMLALSAQRSDTPDGRAAREAGYVNPASARWPHSGTKDVDGGNTYYPGLETYVRDIEPDDWLVLGIVVVDCDQDGPFNLFDYRRLFPPYAVLDTLNRVLGGGCSGEEFYELSGKPDVAARVIQLAPGEWSRGRSFRYRVSGAGLDFTAYGRIEVVR